DHLARVRALLMADHDVVARQDAGAGHALAADLEGEHPPGIAEEFGGLDAAFVIRLGQDGLPGRDASEDGDAGCAERRRGADAARDAPAALEVAALHEDVEVVADAVGGGDPELAADLADRRWESVLSREPLDEPENRARSFVQHGLRSSLTVGRPTCTTAVWCTRVHFVKGLFFRQVSRAAMAHGTAIRYVPVVVTARAQRQLPC